MYMLIPRTRFDPTMSSFCEQKPTTVFREYLRVRSDHPDPDYGKPFKQNHFISLKIKREHTENK